MQRLFSTFANGWPGRALIVLRIALAAYLVHDWLTRFDPAGTVSAIAVIFILAGLWTPIMGTLASLAETWVAFTQPVDAWTAALAAVIAISLALLGPGAYSVDAHIYGRKRISISTSGSSDAYSNE